MTVVTVVHALVVGPVWHAHRPLLQHTSPLQPPQSPSPFSAPASTHTTQSHAIPELQTHAAPRAKAAHGHPQPRPVPAADAPATHRLLPRRLRPACSPQRKDCLETAWTAWHLPCRGRGAHRNGPHTHDTARTLITITCTFTPQLRGCVAHCHAPPPRLMDIWMPSVMDLVAHPDRQDGIHREGVHVEDVGAEEDDGAVLQAARRSVPMPQARNLPQRVQLAEEVEHVAALLLLWFPHPPGSHLPAGVPLPAAQHARHSARTARPGTQHAQHPHTYIPGYGPCAVQLLIGTLTTDARSLARGGREHVRHGACAPPWRMPCTCRGT